MPFPGEGAVLSESMRTCVEQYRGLGDSRCEEGVRYGVSDDI